MGNTQDKSVEIELSEKGSNLYIFFGGIASRIAMPPFEFYKSSQILDQHRIYIRDLAQCWYQNGLAGISQDIYATASYIRSKIDEIGPKKVFFVGNSMGGYAAILFAALVGIGEAITFAPQTFISPALRFRHKDLRWRKRVLVTYAKSVFKRKVWDLGPLLARTKSNPKVSIYVSKENQLDLIHARHLKGIAGVNIHVLETGGHGVVKVLRDEGKLPAIMLGTYAQHDTPSEGSSVA